MDKLFPYQSEYINKFYEKVNSISQEKGESLNYEDFNRIDLVHPGGQEGIDKTFTDYNPSRTGKSAQAWAGFPAPTLHHPRNQ